MRDEGTRGEGRGEKREPRLHKARNEAFVCSSSSSLVPRPSPLSLSSGNRDDRKNPVSYITGVGVTPYGKHPGRNTLDLMSDATTMALADAQLERGDIDGLVCGYSTTLPHLMLSTVFAEHFGLKPGYAHAIQLGGATGFAMAMLAHHLVPGRIRRREEHPRGRR